MANLATEHDTPTTPEPEMHRGHALLLVEATLLACLLCASAWVRCDDMGLQYISDDDMRMLVPALDILGGRWFPAWGHAVGPIHYGAVNLYLYAALIALAWRPGAILVLGALVHVLGTAGVWAAARERAGVAAAFIAAGLLSVHPWAITAARNLGTTYFAIPFVGLALWGLCRTAAADERRASWGPLIGLTGASLAALSHPTGMVVGGVLGLGCLLRAARRRRLWRPLARALGLNTLLWAPYLWEELGQRGEGLATAARVVSAGTSPIEASIGETSFRSDIGWLQRLAEDAPTTAEALSQLAAGHPGVLVPLLAATIVALALGGLQRSGRPGARDASWALAATALLVLALHRLERSAGYAYDHHLQTALPTAAFCIGWAVQQLANTLDLARWRTPESPARESTPQLLLGLTAALLAIGLHPGAMSEVRARLDETLAAGIAVWGRADQVAWHIARDARQHEGCLGLAVLELATPENPYDAAKHALPLLLQRNGLPMDRMPWSLACRSPGAERPVYLVSMGPTDWDAAKLEGSPLATRAVFTDPIHRATLRCTLFPSQEALATWLTQSCDEALRRARVSYLDGESAWQWWDSDIGIPEGADGWSTPCIEQEGAP